MLAAPNLLFAGDGPGVVAWSWASCSSRGWTRCPPEVPLNFLNHYVILCDTCGVPGQSRENLLLKMRCFPYDLLAFVVSL